MAGDYGAVERLGEAEAATLKPQGRPALPKFIAPVLVLILAGCACVLVSALYRADNQMSQVRGAGGSSSSSPAGVPRFAPARSARAGARPRA
jgi:hypothetical protein